MKSETIPVELPKDILKAAEAMGLTKEQIKERLQSFAVVELVSNIGNLSQKDAEKISDKIKAAAWQKMKQKM